MLKMPIDLMMTHPSYILYFRIVGRQLSTLYELLINN